MPPRVAHTVVVALAAFAARAAWGLSVDVPPAWDGELYERGARAIAAGLGYSCAMFGPQADPNVPTAYYPVGYPALLGAFYVLFGPSTRVVALLGAGLGALSAALTHRLALRVTGPRASLLAGLAYALSPGVALFASTPMTETLWGALLALAVWALAPRGALTTRRLFLCALALAAAVYVRPQAMLLVPLLPALPDGDLRLRARRAALVTAVTVALVAPWSLRNCGAIDGCAFVSTNGGGNLAIGAIPRADGMFTFLTPTDGCRGVRGEVARDRCWRRVAIGHIRRDPWRWLSLSVAKVHHTWAYEAFPVGYIRTARPDLLTPADETRWRRRITPPWRLVLYAALLAMLPLFPRAPLGVVGRLSLATMAVVTLTHAVFFGGDRYHLPLVTFALVIASAAGRSIPGLRRAQGGALSPVSDLGALALDARERLESQGDDARGRTSGRQKT